MQITPQQLDFFLKKLPPGLRFALVYGADEGMISISVNKIIDAALAGTERSMAVSKHEYKDIRSNPSVLKDEWQTQSLLCSNRVILVENCAETINAELRSLIKEPPQKSTYLTIFIAGEIRKSSGMVTAFENVAHAVAVPCYKPDLETIQKFVFQWLKAHNVSYEDGVPHALASLMPPDHLVMENELNKLVLYSMPLSKLASDSQMQRDLDVQNQNVHDDSSTKSTQKLTAKVEFGKKPTIEKRVSLADVYTVFVDESEMSIDALCHAFCMRDQAEISKQFSRNYSAAHGASLNMLILRALQNYLFRLLKIKQHMEEGNSAEQALAKIKPPVFFKHKNAILQAVHKLSEKQIYRLLGYILRLEVKFKNTAGDASFLLHQSLLVLAE